MNEKRDFIFGKLSREETSPPCLSVSLCLYFSLSLALQEIKTRVRLALRARASSFLSPTRSPHVLVSAHFTPKIAVFSRQPQNAHIQSRWNLFAAFSTPTPQLNLTFSRVLFLLPFGSSVDASSCEAFVLRFEQLHTVIQIPLLVETVQNPCPSFIKVSLLII